MSELATIAPLVIEGVEINIVGERIRLSGVLSMRSPSETVTPFFKRIHSAAIKGGVKTLVVDLTQLRFMNSSSIRSLVDWVEWIRSEPEQRRYVLHFVTKPDATWQETTLTAIRAFGGEQVVVSRG
ncbi:MAG TPA: hypothetical protein VHM19_17605 [Polyangiales bacterium]|jgi:hypothetical protein|nr:hypothetical protein [Polyangiales bacterium]